jgi:hypothetical protein
MASSGWVVGAEETTLGRNLRVEPGSGATPGKGFMACSGVLWCGVGPKWSQTFGPWLRVAPFCTGNISEIPPKPLPGSEVGTGRCNFNWRFKNLQEKKRVRNDRLKDLADTERPLSARRPLATVLFIKVNGNVTYP